jgi:hypothetical protein
MHIVILAWLYVTFTMALTLSNALAGVALFLVGGLGPVLAWGVLAARRGRNRRAASMREHDVRAGDDAHAQQDQR